MIYDVKNQFIISENKKFFFVNFPIQGQLGLIAALHEIDTKNKSFFIVNLHDITKHKNNNFTGRIKFLFKKALEICNNNDRKLFFVIDAMHEAPTYKYDLKNFIDKISVFFNYSLENFIIFSGALHQHGDLVNFAISLRIAFPHKKIFNNTNVLNLPKTHFVSLVRLPKQFRVIATCEILDRNLLQYGSCSLGSVTNESYSVTNESYKDLMFEFAPEKYKPLLPLSIDGRIDSNDKAYKGFNKKISHAFINFVHESGYERELNNDYYNVPFITEKSIKPFIWGQIPIFLTYYNTLDFLRNLGFDLFDDIINHSYDNERDPKKRITMVVDELEKICKWSIDECKNYKINNLDRFIKNRNLVEDILYNRVGKMQVESLKLALEKYDN